MTPELQDDELLRSYLLGRLPDEEADTLERRLLAEDDLFDLAEAVEHDLLAAVDRGALPPEERDQILRRLAASPRGRERLALARSLNALATESRKVLSFARRAPAFPPPAIHWMALAASLVMLAGLGWFAWQHREQAPGATERVAVQTPVPTPQPPAPVAPPLATSITAKTPNSTTNQPAVRKKPRQAVSAAILTLSFLTSRGAEESQKLELAPGTRKVEIQIDAEGLEPAGSFDVVVRSREQGIVLEKKGLAIGSLSWGRGLILDIAAERLPVGRYEVAVTPQGGEEMTQGFEVVEKNR